MTMIRSRQPHVHVCVNAGKLVAMRSDLALAAAVNSADVISPDGQPIVWAGKLLGLPVQDRVNGTNLMMRLIAEADHRKLRIFLLGATESVLNAVCRKIEQDFPGARIVGAHHGYFTRDEETRVIDQIRQSGADILFVAISSPRKETWLAANKVELGIPFMMGVGGSFDVIAGLVRRAPDWAQRAGLEWFYRLMQEPRRMWRRYLIGNSLFVWMVLRAWVRPEAAR